MNHEPKMFHFSIIMSLLFFQQSLSCFRQIILLRRAIGGLWLCHFQVLAQQRVDIFLFHLIAIRESQMLCNLCQRPFFDTILTYNLKHFEVQAKLLANSLPTPCRSAWLLYHFG